MHPDLSRRLDPSLTDHRRGIGKRSKILTTYPKATTTPGEFKKFGQDVELELARKRVEREDDGYTEDCLLAVTLDRDAPGWVAEFIRVEVGFYPITREAQH